MPEGNAVARPMFDRRFQAEFEELLKWRRDVRRFRPDPLPEDLVRDLLRLADLAPSVGNSQPWRIVRVDSLDRRAAIVDNFEAQNTLAARSYDSERAERYSSLKLAGLQEAPVHLAIYCDEQPEQGYGLGRATMPETLAYSTVGMIQTLWLAARARGVGLGWLSILDAAAVSDVLDVPSDWCLVAYLCLGYPQEDHLDPELERHDWQARTDLERRVFLR